jgi:hypothetical protein
MTDKLWNAQDVADHLGMPKDRVYDNWRAWDLPFFKIGQQLRMRPIDLEIWIAQKAAA